jgi:diguanylate cyclase (GGDEF)-like protein
LPYWRTQEEAAAWQDRFTSVEEPIFFHTRTTSAFWFRFTIDRFTADAAARILEIDNSNMERIDIYFPGHPVIPMGRKVDIRSIPMKTRNQSVAIPRDVDENSPVYLRVQTTTIMFVPLRALTVAERINKMMGETLFFGFFFGIIIAIFFVNLFSLFLLKNQNFKVYLFYLFFLLLYQFRVHGFSYLLPIPFAVQNFVLWISLGGLGSYMMLFAKRFLGLRLRLPLANKILDIFLVLFLLQTVTGCFFSTFWANQIAYITGFLVPIVIIVSTTVIYFSGYREARYYLLAWCSLFTGTLIWSTSSYAAAQIPANYFFIVGTALDSLLFTLAIFDQIKTELMEKAAISESEKYYIDLSRTDALTGLYNRRYLDDIVRRLESEDAISDQHSIIMLDLDYFKKINDTYGHPAGDIVLINVSAKIKSHIRKTDIACRYGGDEFLIYLPGATVQTAQTIAEKIRADIGGNHCIDNETGNTINHTVSIGITENRNNDSFDASFLRADAALYKAKKSGRNCIAVL